MILIKSFNIETIRSFKTNKKSIIIFLLINKLNNQEILFVSFVLEKLID